MIHAYHWLIKTPEKAEHGTEFMKTMLEINSLAGTKITVSDYFSF